MVSREKVFILGSCVSRDAFQFSSANDFQVVDYFARSSLASLASQPYVDEDILKKIESKWQRKVVQADMEKSVLNKLRRNDFDILLVDLIDERFALSKYGRSLHTVSSEYKKALPKNNKYSVIKANSKEKYDLWLKGLATLSEVFRKYGLDKKLIVNKVFWSEINFDTRKHAHNHSVEDIENANNQLSKMYSAFKMMVPNLKFIEYKSSELEVDLEHKWGVSPFHYSYKTYLKTLSEMRRIRKS